MTYRMSRLLIVALFVVILFSLSKTISLYVDWLFFCEVGYEDTFTKMLSAEVFTGLAFGAAFFLFLFLNVFLVSAVNVPTTNITFMGQTRIAIDPGRLGKIFRLFGVAIALIGGVVGGLWGSSLWPTVLAFMNSIDAGRADPVFNYDISFYLFRLPMYEVVNGFAGFLIFLTILLVTVGYAVRGGLFFTGKAPSLVRGARKHLAALVVLFFVKLAIGFWLDRFEILYTPHAVLTGAAYADVNARLVMLGVLIPITLIGGIVFCYGLLKERMRIALYPVIVLTAVFIFGVLVYPGLLQSFKVAPNEQAMEEPFIGHHIAFTRYGYNLDNVHITPFDVSFNLTSKDLVRNEPTIKNIRLWDEAPLLKTYSQLQQIRTYYRFSGIDTDRYIVDGHYRQVMLAPRELSYNDLPSKSWINEKFVFTHGNGLVVGPVSKISKEGLPEFLIKDIPPSSSTNVKITTPEIYFGELTSDYVVVNTKIPEFSYPTAEGNIYTSYKGSGGVVLDSLWKKALFASHFRNAKIVLSSEIKAESRVIYRRNVTERVKTIAPFLMLDADPYVVVGDDGRLRWIIDAYTTSDRLPYSKQLKNWVNYMRNSVKIVVDAYSGKVSFYVSDRDDVVIKMYASIFPGMFKNIADMPTDLKRHVRYPRDLFRIQTAMYATYHMTDPKVFYNKEDLWEVPVHNDKAMDANYLIMKLPEEKREEFVILVPYTPAKRDNLAAWFAARCDEQNYGKLLVFTFPRDRLVFGPRQIDARIDQNSYISQQLSLWNQRGSTVIRGRLLIIPIEKSLLYIQPLYLAAEDKGGLPELRRVIVAYENDVIMEENLEAALTALFGGRKTSLQPQGTPSPDQKMSVQDLAKEAGKAFERAKALQRQGDWAGYGEALKKLEQLLGQMTGK